MPFITGDRQAPFQLRMARVLLFVEAMIAFLYVAAVLLASFLLSSSPLGSGGSAGTATSSTVPINWLWFTLVALGGLGFSVVCWGVGKVAPWARWAAIGLQLPVLILVVSAITEGNPVSAAFTLACAAGIVACLAPNRIAAVFRDGIAAQPRSTIWVPPPLDDAHGQRPSTAGVVEIGTGTTTPTPANEVLAGTPAEASPTSDPAAQHPPGQGDHTHDGG